MRRMMLVGVLLLVGCGQDPGEVSEVVTSAPAEVEASEVVETGPQADSAAKVACRHFRNVVGDASILSDEELREKIKEVHESARVSEADGIAENARTMLEEVTGGDAETFGEAAESFSDACAEVGM